MDLAGQLAAVWARRFILVLTALSVAAAVFTWRSAAPDRFEATSTLQVRLPDTDSSDPSTQVGYYAETVVGLLTSRVVVADALNKLGRSDDPETVAEDIDPREGSEPGFVSVTAVGETAREAALLSDALVAAVSTRVATDQERDLAAERGLVERALADVLANLAAAPVGDNALRSALIREREELLSALRSNANRVPWQVAVVDAADEPTSPTSPTPLRDALLAFLVALILAAELLVVVRAWRGSISVRDPAGDVSKALGVPTVEVPRHAGIAALASLLPHLGSARRVAVIRVGPRPNGQVAVLLAELLAERGRSVVLADAGPDSPSLSRALDVPPGPGLASLPEDDRRLAQVMRGLPRLGDVRVLQAGEAPIDEGPTVREQISRVVATDDYDSVVLSASVGLVDDLVSVLEEGSDVMLVLDVDASGATKRDLGATAAALRGLGSPLVAATVSRTTWRPHLRRRRRPRDAHYA